MKAWLLDLLAGQQRIPTEAQIILAPILFLARLIHRLSLSATRLAPSGKTTYLGQDQSPKIDAIFHRHIPTASAQVAARYWNGRAQHNDVGELVDHFAAVPAPVLPVLAVDGNNAGGIRRTSSVLGGATSRAVR
jgi:hypothetical protein